MLQPQRFDTLDLFAKGGAEQNGIPRLNAFVIRWKVARDGFKLGSDALL